MAIRGGVEIRILFIEYSSSGGGAADKNSAQSGVLWVGERWHREERKGENKCDLGKESQREGRPKHRVVASRNRRISCIERDCL